MSFFIKRIFLVRLKYQFLISNFHHLFSRNNLRYIENVHINHYCNFEMFSTDNFEKHVKFESMAHKHNLLFCFFVITIDELFWWKLYTTKLEFFGRAARKYIKLNLSLRVLVKPRAGRIIRSRTWTVHLHCGLPLLIIPGNLHFNICFSN